MTELESTIMDATDPVSAGAMMLFAFVALLLVFWVCLRDSDGKKPPDDYDLFFPEDWE